MANTLTMHRTNFGRFCFTGKGASVTINGVPMVADGEPETRSYEGADNIPAIEAFCTAQLSTKKDPRPQAAKLLADGVYLIVDRAPVTLASPEAPVTADGGKAPKKG